MVRAKFMLTEIREHSSYKVARTLIFKPQYDSSIEEDRRFAQTTPNGTFEMFVDNPAALTQFGIGKLYYFDITPCPIA